MKNKFAFALLALTSVLLLNFMKYKKLSIEGSWIVAEVQTVKPDGTSTKVSPKESFAFFNDKNYSFCWTFQYTKERNWAMKDSLKLDRFNQSIVNSGTYELKDSILTTKALFAMNPMFVNGLAKFKCSMKGDTLILRGLSVASSDNILHPVYKNGSYIITKLVRK